MEENKVQVLNARDKRTSIKCIHLIYLLKKISFFKMCGSKKNRPEWEETSHKA